MTLDVIIGRSPNSYDLTGIQESPLERLYLNLIEEKKEIIFYEMIGQKDDPRTIEAIVYSTKIRIPIPSKKEPEPKFIEKRLELKRTFDPVNIKSYDEIIKRYLHPTQETLTLTNNEGYIEITSNEDGTYNLFNVSGDKKDPWAEGQNINLNEATQRLYSIIHPRKPRNIKGEKLKT